METAYIGLGGNMDSHAGPPAVTLAACVGKLEEAGRVVARSHLYSTEPVGYADQPRFVNAVVALETELPPLELLQVLLQIEREFGRDRSTGIQNGPRTLDLDLLLYGQAVMDEPGLAVPHPRLLERTFVLAPLAEIAPHLQVPRTGATVKELLQRLQSAPLDDSNAVVLLENDLWRTNSAPPTDSAAGPGLRAEQHANPGDAQD